VIEDGLWRGLCFRVCSRRSCCLYIRRSQVISDRARWESLLPTCPAIRVAFVTRKKKIARRCLMGSPIGPQKALFDWYPHAAPKPIIVRQRVVRTIVARDRSGRQPIRTPTVTAHSTSSCNLLIAQKSLVLIGAALSVQSQ